MGHGFANDWAEDEISTSLIKTFRDQVLEVLEWVDTMIIVAL